MAWGVTVSDVFNATGASATDPQIAVADAVVTIYVNRQSTASASISPRDIGWIKSAIQWQTVWMPSQSGYNGRSQFDSLSQDGLSIQSSAQWAKELAPLAARSIKNLSWKGSRTQRTPAVVPGLDAYGQRLDFTLEASDRYSHWDAL